VGEAVISLPHSRLYYPTQAKLEGSVEITPKPGFHEAPSHSQAGVEQDNPPPHTHTSISGCWTWRTEQGLLRHDRANGISYLSLSFPIC
jgi:hypothetical protein